MSIDIKTTEININMTIEESIILNALLKRAKTDFTGEHFKYEREVFNSILNSIDKAQTKILK